MPHYQTLNPDRESGRHTFVTLSPVIHGIGFSPAPSQTANVAGSTLKNQKGKGASAASAASAASGCAGGGGSTSHGESITTRTKVSQL